MSLILSAPLVAQLDPPVLHCASVDVNGNVTLTWTPPADPGGEFGSYAIHHSTNANGPYTVLYTIGVFGQFSQVHTGAIAGSGPQFYYMTTTTSGPSPLVSVPSDTIATIYLQLFQSTPMGSADLSWNAPALAPTASDSFDVWMEYPIGTWSLLGRVPRSRSTYRHVVSVCEDSLTFRVDLADANGCISRSNVAGDVFQDMTPPTSPVISTVTVDTLSGLATLSWQPSPEGDTDGYIIVFNAPGGAVVIDTVYGQSTTSYEWIESQAAFGFESYTVAAFDTCEVGVPPSPNTSATTAMHRTIYLEQFYDDCAGEVTLIWSPYVGWPVAEYGVYMQVDGGPWILLANLIGSATSHVHEVEPFRVYCYAIRASRGPSLASSLSNRTCVATDYPGLPTFNYLRTVTVSGEEEIRIVDSVDVAANVLGYRLERSADGAAFEVIDSRGPTLSPTITFVDTDVRPATVGYRYRVVVLDACGNRTLLSNIGGNIVLRATAQLSGIDLLEWNGYAVWAGSVQAYAIYRKIEDGGFQLLDIRGPNPWQYADDVSNLTATNGRFCYYVLALEEGNPSGINATSTSNEVCAVQQDLVYIPNAFVVGGANPVFRPELAYADVREYELSIINRWGQVFWTTNDPFEAWDGTYGGKLVPIGVYAYYCNYRNGAGRVFEKRGTVTLLTALE